MLWPRLPSEKSEDTNNRDILGVFRVLVVAAMGCLFGCFRINDGSLPPDSKSQLVSQSLAPKVLLYPCLFFLMNFVAEFSVHL